MREYVLQPHICGRGSGGEHLLYFLAFVCPKAFRNLPGSPHPRTKENIFIVRLHILSKYCDLGMKI